MPPTIRIDEEVYGWLQAQARPFEDTPNSVLRRISGLGAPEAKEPQVREVHQGRNEKTSQQAFRQPLLRVLRAHGGEVSRLQALKEIEEQMADRLTEYDKADISSGTIRWEKSAEWEVRAMRIEELLKPAHATPWGVWALTERGWEVASSLPPDDSVESE